MYVLILFSFLGKIFCCEVSSINIHTCRVPRECRQHCQYVRILWGRLHTFWWWNQRQPCDMLSLGRTPNDNFIRYVANESDIVDR